MGYSNLLAEEVDVEKLTVEDMIQREKEAHIVLNAGNVASTDPEILSKMLDTGWAKLNLKITNIVGSLSIRTASGEPCLLNLPLLALMLQPYAVELNTPNFPALIISLVNDVNVDLLVFSTGSVVVTGFVHDTEMVYALEFLRSMLRECGYSNVHYNLDTVKLSNYVATVVLPEQIDKDKFYAMFPATTCNPDFPGLFVQFPSRDGDVDRTWTALVFKGRKCNLMGCKDMTEMRALFHIVLPMLFVAKWDAMDHLDEGK